MQNRCAWVNLNNQLYIDYHDNEWAIPIYDDNKLFANLILEGAQAGLNWEIILNKRQNYYIAFDNFDPAKIAQYDQKKYQELLTNKGIIRNKLKINSAINNAKIFLQLQKEYGSFSEYIWQYVAYKPIINNFTNLADLPSKTALSNQISRDLQKRGMNFVGSTIIYAFMQAIGMVNDHLSDCFLCPK